MSIRLHITVICLATLALIAFISPRSAQALNCADIGGTASGDNCTLNANYLCTTANVTIDIPGDLTINASKTIDCTGRNLTINVGGDFVVNGTVKTDGSNGTPGINGAAVNCTGNAGAAGNAGGNGVNATEAGSLTINVDGAFEIGSTGVVTANGANGGAGGNGTVGCTGANAGNNNGATGSTGGAGGKGGNGGTCSAGKNISINSGTDHVLGDIYIAGILSSKGGNGGSGGTAAAGAVGGNGSNRTGSAAGDGGLGGTGGAGGAGGIGADGCAGGQITINEDFTVAGTGSLDSSGGNGGTGSNGAIGGTGGIGGDHGTGTGNSGVGGTGGVGGVGGNSGNCGTGGVNQVSSAGDVEVGGSMLAKKGTPGNGGSGGKGGTGGKGGDMSRVGATAGTGGTGGTGGQAGNGGAAGSTGGTGSTGATKGPTGPAATGGAGGTGGNGGTGVAGPCTGIAGSNTINHCDTAAYDPTGAILDPVATVNSDEALCKPCSITFDKRVINNPGTYEVVFDYGDYCDLSAGTCVNDSGVACDSHDDCRIKDLAVGVDGEAVQFEYCLTNTGEIDLVAGTLSDKDVETDVITYFTGAACAADGDCAAPFACVNGECRINIPFEGDLCIVNPDPAATCDDQSDIEGEDMADLTITCAGAKAPTNSAKTLTVIMDSDNAKLDCQVPGLNATKSCDLQSGQNNKFEFDVTVSNTGTANLIDCTFSDQAETGECPVGSTFDNPIITDEPIGSLSAGYCTGITPTNCCNTGNGTGCEDAACEAIVCAMDSDCCTVDWDGSCADEAAASCGGASAFNDIYDNSGAGFLIEDESCNNIKALCKIDDGTGNPAKDSTGDDIVAESEVFTDTCVPEEASDASRGQGWWKNHSAAVGACIAELGGQLNLGFTICGDNEDGAACILGIFWSNPGQFGVPGGGKGKPVKRSDTCKARMQLATHYIPAVCNCELFGNCPATVDGCTLSQALGYLASGTPDQMRMCKNYLEIFNEDGENIPLPPLDLGAYNPDLGKGSAVDPTTPVNCN